MTVTYSDTQLIASEGTATPDDITAWFVATAADGLAYVRRQTTQPNLPLNPIPDDLGEMIVEECARYGSVGVVANHDLVAGDIAHEAAQLQSMIVRAKANPSGLGAENDDPARKAIDFTEGGTVPYREALRLGIRATVAHFLNYAVGGGPWSAADPRLAALMRASYLGIAPTLRGLNGRWAFPGPTYGQNIADKANGLLAFAGRRKAQLTMYENIIPGLVDIRHKLATAAPGEGGIERGPYETIPLSEKRGIVVHYRGVVTPEKPGYASYQADAVYHVGKNWVKAGETPVLGSGIMYHVGVGFDGTRYLLRDLDRVLWHCGSWPQNANTLAIQLPLGGQQQATAAQLDSLRDIADAWFAYTDAPKRELWGHQELSPTPCPGTLMDSFIRPYRAGAAPPVVQPPAAEIPGASIDPWRGDNPYAIGRDPFYILDPFLGWINARGGLFSIGYCRTGAFIEDDKLVQYFEGGRLEWHPGNAAEYRVLRGLTGNEVIQYRYAGQPPA